MMKTNDRGSAREKKETGLRPLRLEKNKKALGKA